MATMVKHEKTGHKYILLGAGFGMYMSSKPHAFFGDLVADKKEGQMALVTVCNHEGNIGWLPSEEVTVVSIDGKRLRDFYS